MVANTAAVVPKNRDAVIGFDMSIFFATYSEINCVDTVCTDNNATIENHETSKSDKVNAPISSGPKILAKTNV